MRSSNAFWIFLALSLTVGVSGCQLGATANGAARGKELFETCVPCHGRSAQGNFVVGAPNIGGMKEWYVEAELQKFRAGTRGTHFNDAEGMRMRPMAQSLMSDQDVKSVAAYVASLPPVTHAGVLGGDPQAGRRRYTLCGACHGAKGVGNDDVKAPRLAGVDDWYLATELRKFKQGVRGGNPLDVEGSAMRPMTASLTNEKAIRDLVAYIGTLKTQPSGPENH